MRNNIRKLGPFLPPVAYRKPNAAITLPTSDSRDYSNVPEKREEDTSLVRSVAKDVVSIVRKYMQRVANQVPRAFGKLVETNTDPLNISMSMRVKIENFPKIYDAYKKLRGIREEDLGDNGITYILPMHGVTREDVDWMVLRNVLLISASRKDSFEHYYQIPLPNGCTKNDVQLSEDFKLGQLLVWIAKEPGGIRVPLHAGKSLNQHSPSMPLSAASAGPVNLTTYCYEHGRKFEILNEVPTIDVHGSHGKSSYAFADLPKEVVMTLVQGSVVTCLEFHPQHQNLLLVGTNSGEIAIWDFGSRDKLVQKDFKVSNLGACSGSLQVIFLSSSQSDDGVQFNRRTHIE